MSNTTSTALTKERPLSLGWIGAGKMGAPMIRNLLAQGLEVSVSEPSEAQLSAVVDAGATGVGSLADYADADIVFATLPNDAVLTHVVFGANGTPGLVDILPAGASFVEMSTVSPKCSEHVAAALAEKSILYLRAPLSGSTALAESATLTVLASGDKAAWDLSLPYFEIMSARQFYLGEAEEARFMKLVLNTLVGSASALLAEALALGSSGGLSHASMMDVIGESAVASPLLKYKTDTIVSGDYTPAFSVEQMIKDFTLITGAAQANQVPTFTTGLILELYRAAANGGLKDQDFFALVKWQSDLLPKE